MKPELKKLKIEQAKQDLKEIDDIFFELESSLLKGDCECSICNEYKNDYISYKRILSMLNKKIRCRKIIKDSENLL